VNILTASNWKCPRAKFAFFILLQ